MDTLRFFLFGKFRGWYGEQPLAGFEAHKVQELFCYLLLYRDHPHPREFLADLLWGDTNPLQSKNYLRKTLWQLQAILKHHIGSEHSSVLVVEPDSLQLNPEAVLWLDVAILEQAFKLFFSVPGQNLSESDVQILCNAVDIYRGDLLEGWYTDWCLYERERLQYAYLTLIDKLLDYCGLHQEYESGIAYGLQALHCDPARERTHRRLMRLHYLAGDRTAALHQYERCVVALERELDVKPSERTVFLYEQIRADHLRSSSQEIAEAIHPAMTQISELLARLKTLDAILINLEGQIHQNIQEIELALMSQR